MLEQIKAMERAGQWAELRLLGSGALSSLSGDDLARGLLALAKAYEETGSSPAEYRQSAWYVQAAVSAASPGSFMHTWALGRAAAVLSDLGNFQEAGEAAGAFLAQLDGQPKAAPLLPWVHFAMGQVDYYSRRPVDAARHFRTALAAGADGALAERLSMWLAWSLAAAGRVVDAFAAIPNDVQHISRGHIFAAMARVCYAARDLQGARLNARFALGYAHEWAAHDSLQVAELRLILDRSTEHGGAGAVRFDDAALFALCSEAVLSVLAASLGRAGGELFEAARSSGGLPAGHKRCGLLGAVG